MTDLSQKKVVLFDLDGTLTDPKEGITRSVAYALSKFGIAVPDRDALLPFIGPPLRDAFLSFYGFGEEDAEQAVAYYRERFSAVGIYENRLYDGIPALLERLRRAGRTICLATSKPEVFATKILSHFHLAEYFDFQGGATLDRTRDRKAEVIQYVLDAVGADRTETVMVGDREHDIIGAKACGIASIGVLYGYGSEEELRQAGADGIAKGLADLSRLLLGEDGACTYSS